MKNDTFNHKTDGDTLVVSRTEYEQLHHEIAGLKEQVELLTEALRLAQHKRFGASSEKNTEDVSEQTSLFNEAEVCADEQKAAEETTTVAGHVRRKKKEYTLDNLPEGIPVEIVEHRLPEEELACPQCGDTMTEIGVETVRKLKAKPAQFYVQEDRYYSYACQSCKEQEETTPVIKTPHEKSVIPGSFATPEAIAHIIPQGTFSCC